jgi:hypothetical protein
MTFEFNLPTLTIALLSLCISAWSLVVSRKRLKLDQPNINIETRFNPEHRLHDGVTGKLVVQVSNAGNIPVVVKKVEVSIWGDGGQRVVELHNRKDSDLTATRLGGAEAQTFYGYGFKLGLEEEVSGVVCETVDGQKFIDNSRHNVTEVNNLSRQFYEKKKREEMEQHRRDIEEIFASMQQISGDIAENNNKVGHQVD